MIRSLMRPLLFSTAVLSAGVALPALAGTWTVAKDNMATVLMGVDFQDANTGSVVGADNASGGSVILRTIDGGRTWLNQQDNPMQVAMYLDISYGDSTHAVAGGLGMYYRWAGASYTVDGKNWKPAEDRWLVAAYQDVEAVDANNMYLIGEWAKIYDYWYGVAASTDGGHTFNRYEWGIDTQARYGSFPSASTGFVSGGQWPYESATARGAKVPQIGKGDVQLSRYVRVPGKPLPKPKNMKTAYDGYWGVIAKTENGGESWRVVYEDFDRFYFNGIYFLDDMNGWAVAEGDAGAWIIHTADGGESWDEQHFEAGASLFNVAMVDDLEGWAVGGYLGVSYKALFLHTTDGGLTWTPVETGIGKYYLFNIDMVDRDHGFATALSPAGAGSVLKYAP